MNKFVKSIIGTIVMIALVRKFKEAAKDYKYFPLEKKIIYISGISFFLCLGPRYIMTGTLVQPLYDFRYFILIIFLVTTVTYIRIFFKNK